MPPFRERPHFFFANRLFFRSGPCTLPEFALPAPRCHSAKGSGKCPAPRFIFRLVYCASLDRNAFLTKTLKVMRISYWSDDGSKTQVQRSIAFIGLFLPSPSGRLRVLGQLRGMTGTVRMVRVRLLLMVTRSGASSILLIFNYNPAGNFQRAKEDRIRA